MTNNRGMDDRFPDTGPVAIRPKKSFNVIDLLASTRFAVAVVLLLVIACIVGTVLPQDGQVEQYLQKYPDKAGRMAVLGTLGLTHVFSASWFIALLCTLALSLVVCSQRRFSAIVRTHGSLRGRATASLVLHSSILLILAGGVIRAVWGEKGYVQFREGEMVNQFVSAKGPRPLPYSVRLEKFEIETYTEEELKAGQGKKSSPEDKWGQIVVQWPANELVDRFPAQPDTERVLRPEGEPESSTNVARIRVVRFVPDFIMDMSTRQVVSRSDVPRNPAIQVQVDGAAGSGSMWLFGLHPEFNTGMGGHGGAGIALDMRYRHKGNVREAAPIKSFRSTVAILDKDAPAPAIRKLEVNSPLSHKGYTFYQSGYNERDPSWTSLQVVRDPGVIVVYAGFALTMIGLFMLFYVYPQRPPATPSLASAEAGEVGMPGTTGSPTTTAAEGGTHDTGVQS